VQGEGAIRREIIEGEKRGGNVKGRKGTGEKGRGAREVMVRMLIRAER
jgi:hypothetical protein